MQYFFYSFKIKINKSIRTPLTQHFLVFYTILSYHNEFIETYGFQYLFLYPDKLFDGTTIFFHPYYNTIYLVRYLQSTR